MTYAFKNLVFEGGGVKGIAYLGALEILNEKGITPQIERIGGTSAGAINAILVGLGFNPEETHSILWKLDFHDFMDESWGCLGGIWRLLQRYGWYKGDFFRRWIGDLIKQKTGSSETTFDELETMKAARKFKSLYFIGTNLSTSYSEVFSAQSTPQMCIADAVRISMSIPLFFASMRRGSDVYVDGGVLDNYPIKLFDREDFLYSKNFTETDYYRRINQRRPASAAPSPKYIYNKETLGFRLDTKEDIAVFHDHAPPAHSRIGDFPEYTWALIKTLLDAQQNTHLHSDDWARTVYIDTLGVSTIDFDLSDERKTALYDSGRDCTLKYFEWFDSADTKPNR